MEVNKEQIVAVSNLEPKERYAYFIKQWADYEAFFTLKNENGEFVLSEAEGNTLFHVWSAPEFAQLCLVETWEKHSIVEVPLNEFEDNIMGLIKENAILIDVFPVGNQSGWVVSLEELVRDLNSELEKY